MIITYIAYTTIDLRLPEKSDKYHWSRVRASVFFGNNESSKRRTRGESIGAERKMERINSNIIYVNPSRILGRKIIKLIAFNERIMLFQVFRTSRI